MSPSQARIAIIGCGPAGLTAGLLLHKHGIPFTIFELRPKPTDEELSKPSGSFDLHKESGLAAIEECGLTEEFLHRTTDCTEAQKVSDKDGNILLANEGLEGAGERPEISRHALTKLLLAHIPAEAIKWGHKLRSATQVTAADGTAQIELDFDLSPSSSSPSSLSSSSHGSDRQIFDLVVGADGAWSRVRRLLLTDTKPEYMGKQCITVTIRELAQKRPDLDELVGSGSFMALGIGHGVIAQRGAQGSARLYVFLTTADEHFALSSGLATQTAAAAKDQLLSDDKAMLGGWGDRIKELVAAACDAETADNPGARLDIKPLYYLPIGHAWEHKAGATIVGDAAHLMGPWAGEGANLAMWDALALAHAIVEARDAAGQAVRARGGGEGDGGDEDVFASLFRTALDPLLKEFEAELVARAKEKAQETYDNGVLMYSEDGARAVADVFSSMGPPPPE